MRAKRAVLSLALSAVAVAANCFDRPAEFGVSVFSADTMPVNFTISVTGSLEMALRAQTFTPLPDKTLLLTTPAQLLVNKGEGTATITSRTGGRLVVQPLGVNPDSADTSSVEGQVVKMMRSGTQRSVQLFQEKTMTRDPSGSRVRRSGPF